MRKSRIFHILDPLTKEMNQLRIFEDIRNAYFQKRTCGKSSILDLEDAKTDVRMYSQAWKGKQYDAGCGRMQMRRLV